MSRRGVLSPQRDQIKGSKGKYSKKLKLADRRMKDKDKLG
jgi:hypothetical protein